jgi:hypothetical protein
VGYAIIVKSPGAAPPMVSFMDGDFYTGNLPDASFPSAISVLPVFII